MPKTICIYCASSNRIDQVYFEAAGDLARRLAERGDTLLYGGGSIGLMGELARTVHRYGGHVVGVIPQRLMRKEIAYPQADELIVTEDLRSRKAVLMNRADAFAVLPGGFGTLEELSEALTHQHLGYHAKPIVVLNINRFFDPLLKLFDHFFETGAARKRLRSSYYVTEDVDDALSYIDTFDPERTIVKIPEITDTHP